MSDFLNFFSTKKTVSITTAILFIFNSLSWSATIPQNGLRPLSTRQGEGSLSLLEEISSYRILAADGLSFKISSEGLERIKEADPLLAEDISNLIEALQGPKPLAERLAEIEENLASQKTDPDPSLLRLKHLLRSLLKVTVLKEVYIALAEDNISGEKAPLLIRKEGGAYQTAAILDMLPTDVLRIINKFGQEGLKRVKERTADKPNQPGRSTRPIQPVAREPLTAWARFYFQLRNSLPKAKPSPAFLRSLFPDTLALAKFSSDDIPATPDDIKGSLPQSYTPLSVNELGMEEDYYLGLQDMFSQRAIEELNKLHQRLLDLRHSDLLSIRNFNLKLARRIKAGWRRPIYHFITPSITKFRIVCGESYHSGEIVLALSKENHLVPVLIGTEGYTLPGSIKAEPSELTGPTLLTHLSEEAINALLKTLPKDSVEYSIWQAYAQQQGVEIVPKSSSAGIQIQDFAELKVIKNLRKTELKWEVVDILELLQIQVAQKGKLDDFLQGKYIIRPEDFEGVKSPISLIGPFSCVDGIQVALMAIERADKSYRLLALSDGKNPNYYSVSIRNKTIIEAIISQVIESGCLPAEAIPAWWFYLKTQTRAIPELRIKTQSGRLFFVYRKSRFYLAMMKITQPELFEQLISLASEIGKEPLGGEKKFRIFIQEKCPELISASFIDRGLIRVTIDYIFTVKAKNTTQRFLISRCKAISLPSPAGEESQLSGTPDIDRILVVKDSSKSSSAGKITDFADVKLIPTLLSNYLDKNTSISTEAVMQARLFETKLDDKLRDKVSLAAPEELLISILEVIAEKGYLREIFVPIGLFSYEDSEAVLLLIRDKSAPPVHRLIAIGSDEKPYLHALYYDLSVNNMAVFEAIISQAIDSRSLPPESVSTCREYLRLYAKDIPDIEIDTGDKTLGLRARSDVYVERMKHTQPIMYEELMAISSAIKARPLAGARRILEYVKEHYGNLKELNADTLINMGVIKGIALRKENIFRIRAKRTERTKGPPQKFVISGWNPLSSPKQIKAATGEVLPSSYAKTIAVVRSITPKSSSAGQDDEGGIARIHGGELTGANGRLLLPVGRKAKPQQEPRSLKGIAQSA